MNAELLKENIGAFKDFDAVELEDVMIFFDQVSLAPGAELWTYGDGKKHAGFILNGKIVVRKQLNDSKQHVVLGVYGAGSIIGELSLLSERPPMLSAKALEHTELLIIENHRFMELLERRPQLGLSLIKHLYMCTAKRLDKSYDRITSMF